MPTRKLFLLGAIGIVAALVGALIARSVLQPSAAPAALQSGTLLQPPQTVPAFALIDQDSRPFDNAKLRGHWSLLFFGFTNCGDVCPTTLALLANVSRSLGELPSDRRPQIVFVSVDAKRDTPEVVKAYVKNFDPSFTGVTGSQDDLNALTSALGVPSAIRPLENGGYAVDHSAAILAMNPKGEFAALFTPPHTMDALTRDYRLLVGTQ